VVLFREFFPPFAGQAEAVFCPFWGCFSSSGCFPVVLAYFSVFYGLFWLVFLAFIRSFLHLYPALRGWSFFALFLSSRAGKLFF